MQQGSEPLAGTSPSNNGGSVLPSVSSSNGQHEAIAEAVFHATEEPVEQEPQQAREFVVVEAKCYADGTVDVVMHGVPYKGHWKVIKTDIKERDRSVMPPPHVWWEHEIRWNVS